MDDISITRVHNDEFLELTNIWEASVKATHHFLTDKDIAYFRPLVLNEFLPMVTLFAARDSKNKIVGFLGLSAEKIEMLFVHPSTFGRGIGKKLLEFAIKNQNMSKLDVNEQNPSALGFYKHMGFEVIARSDTDAMGKPFPILHMELKRYDF